MNNLYVRRLTLTLVLGVSSLIGTNVARATDLPRATTNGVTGTDPVPPSCGCKNTATSTATTTSSATATSSMGAAAQALLAMLGLS